MSPGRSRSDRQHERKETKVIETETKPPTTEDVLAELERHRAKVREWAGKESAFSSLGMANAQEIERLRSEAAALGRKDPELIDEFGAAVSKTNPVGKLQAAAEKIEDPNSIYLKRDHAGRIREKAERDLADFVLDHFEAIHRARSAQARKVRDGVRALRDRHLEAANAYLDFAHESIGLTGPHPEFNGQHVGGVDEVSDLIRVLGRLEDLPFPTVHGYEDEIPETVEPVLIERPDEDGGDE